MCIGIAADVTQQRLMPDGAAHLIVEARRVRDPHAQHTGSQCEVSRMTRGQVSGISERHQKVSAPDGG